MKRTRGITGLAGAAALAGASQAYAGVDTVTPPPNIVGNNPSNTSSTPTRRYIDLDTGTSSSTNFAGADLELAYRSFTTGTYVIQQSFVFSLSGQTASLAGMYGSYAYKLKSGDAIPGTNPFSQSATYLTMVVTHVNATDYGFWYLGDRGFIGFNFVDKNGTLDYGYIEIETDAYQSAANPGGLKFFSLAYDNTGAPITAGAVPEPSTLAALAFGGFGLAAAAMRKRRSAGGTEA